MEAAAADSVTLTRAQLARVFARLGAPPLSSFSWAVALEESRPPPPPDAELPPAAAPPPTGARASRLLGPLGAPPPPPPPPPTAPDAPPPDVATGAGMLAAARAREAEAERTLKRERDDRLKGRQSTQYLPATRGFASGHRE